MAGKPTEPPPAERSGVGRRADGRERERRGERTGPVAITRLVKDDGRALILYTAQEGRA